MSMGQIQMALVAIALVLSAVFLPMVFFGGSTGVIYRQFSATIVSAMVLSVFVAMTLSPAIAAGVLKRTHVDPRDTGSAAASAPRPMLASAARSSTPASTGCATGMSIGQLCRRPQMAVPRRLCGVCVALAVMFVRLPTGFLPTEDQGAVQIQFRLPAGATLERTKEVQLAVEDYLMNGPGQGELQDLFHRRRRRSGRDRARIPASRSSTSRRFEDRHGKRE